MDSPGFVNLTRFTASPSAGVLRGTLALGGESIPRSFSEVGWVKKLCELNEAGRVVEERSLCREARSKERVERSEVSMLI